MEPERQVPFEEACDLAKDRDILAALETSAKVMSALLLFASFKNAMEESKVLYFPLRVKESQNVEEAFLMMARELLSRNGLNVQREDSIGSSTPRVILRSNSRPIDGFAAAYTPPEKKTCC